MQTFPANISAFENQKKIEREREKKKIANNNEPPVVNYIQLPPKNHLIFGLHKLYILMKKQESVGIIYTSILYMLMRALGTKTSLFFLLILARSLTKK